MTAPSPVPDGFAHPGTGAVVRFVRTGVDADLPGTVLAASAEQVGAGEDEPVVPVLDDTGRHVSGELVLPPGLGPALLPPYTPELLPAEQL